jgi:hypothetical protein
MNRRGIRLTRESIDTDSLKLTHLIDLNSESREYGNLYGEVGWAKGVELK